MNGLPRSPGAWDTTTAVERDGLFRVDFGHELGHAIVGRFGSLRVDDITINGLTMVDGLLHVNGTCATNWWSNPNLPKWHYAVTAAAGAVAEALLANETDVSTGALQRLLHDKDHAGDLTDIEDAGWLHLGRAVEKRDIENAIAKALEILSPRRAQILDFVTECETRAAVSMANPLVVKWNQTIDARFAILVEDRPSTLSWLELLRLAR